MAKYGYKCQCGWRLTRKPLTRKMYAQEKEIHASHCEPLRKELAASRGK